MIEPMEPIEPVGPEPAAVAKVFYTLQQITERHPAFTVRTLRHWIYNSRARAAWIGGRKMLLPGNGFAAVVVKIGNRLYINEPALLEWIECHDEL